MDLQREGINDVSLLVVSCDAYKDLWKPFFHSLFKYWPDCPYPIFLGSNQCTFEDSRVTTINVGQDKDYSSNLLALLSNLDTPWVFIWIEDLFLISSINTERLINLINQAKQDNVGYLKLASNTPWAFTNDENEEMGPLPQGVKYRATMGLALWRKDVLIKLLRKGESAWQIECNGSSRSDSFEEPFYALTPSVRPNRPISVVNSVIKGRWSRDGLRFLNNEGLSDCIPNRQEQPLWSHVYAKCYRFRLILLRRLRRYWYS